MMFTYRPSKWVKRFDCEAERNMRSRFIENANEVMKKSAWYIQPQDSIWCGLELELPLIRQDFSLVPQAHRDALVEALPGRAFVELAAHQLEIINDPAINLATTPIKKLGDDIMATMQVINSYLRKHSLNISRIGCYPLTNVCNVPHTKGDQKYFKYLRCPQWHQANRRNDKAPILGVSKDIDVSNPYVVGLMNAVHVNIDACSMTDAIDKLNRSLMISPMAAALSANAPYLNFSPTGYADVRSTAWEASHDTRSKEELVAGRLTRIGLPRRYYEDMNDYFNRILSYPFVMNDEASLQKAFLVGIGMYWRDARLKFLQSKNKVIVEFRPISLQPSLAADLALTMFYIGRLHWSQHYREPLLPMQVVQENKKSALAYGCGGDFAIGNDGVIAKGKTKDVLAEEVKRAHAGLVLFGEKAANITEQFQVLKQYLQAGSPAEQLMRRVNSYLSSRTSVDDRKEALMRAIEIT